MYKEAFPEITLAFLFDSHITILRPLVTGRTNIQGDFKKKYESDCDSCDHIQNVSCFQFKK